MRGGEVYELQDRSLAVLRLPSAKGEEKNGDLRAALRRSEAGRSSAA